jgi:REP element-mobilizing transposase RayT
MPNPPIVIRDTVKAAHLVLTGYGHWLPNDPRGSGSDEVRKLALEALGPIHFGRKRIQPARRELRAFHRQAEPLLDHPVIWFDEPMRNLIADAIGEVVADRGYTVYACAILRNHAHLVIRTHRDDAFTMLCHLAGVTHDALHAANAVPTDHPIWSDRPYKVFLTTPAAVRDRIDYVERNPAKEGLPPQHHASVGPCGL